MTAKGQKQRRNRIVGVSKRMTSRGETRWRAVVDIGEGADRKQISRTFATQDEAEDWRAQMRTKRRTGDVVEPSRQPLRDWFGEWIATRATVLRPSTIGNYCRNFALLDPSLGGVALSRLTPSLIERTYGELSRQFAPATLRGAHRVLSMVLRTAVRDRLIARNPLEPISAPGDTITRRGAWTIEQARTFLTGCADSPHADAWHVFLECWLRSGELRALRWSDIDLTAGTLSVNRSVTGDEHGRPQLGPTKNASSHRTLVLSPGLIERLRERKHAAKIVAVEFGTGWSEDALVFPNRSGGLMTSGTLCDALRRLCAHLGLPYITVHGLRHAGGSIAYAQRIPSKVISERMGHATVAVTEAIYLHTDQTQHQELAELMGELLRA